MARIVVTEFVSLDGVMQGPGPADWPGGEPDYPHSGWVLDYQDPEQAAFKVDEIRAAEAQLLGRATYEAFADAWPARDGEFADKINAMPKYVASTTARELAWSNSTVLDGDIVDAVSKLRRRDGGDVLVAGSRTLVHTLMEHDLVDEYRLMVFPVVLGSGKRLFPDTPRKRPLRLVDTRAFPNGVVVQTYRPAEAGP